MTYYGLQPLLSNNNLPNILKSSTGLYLMNSNYLLPCVFNNIDINNEFIIPTHPVDTNAFISDTIIKKPTSISLELYIYEEDENSFHDLIKQGVTRGFYFVNRTKTVYENLYLTNKSLSFTNDRFGGFTCSLDLIEVVKVATVASFATLPIQSKKVSQGEVSPKKYPKEHKDEFNKKSCAKGLLDAFQKGGLQETLTSGLGHCADRFGRQVQGVVGKIGG